MLHNHRTVPPTPRRRAARSGLRALVVGLLLALAAPAVASSRPPDVFTSRFSDGLDEFRYQNNPNRIQVVDDPVLGAARKVLRFRVGRGDAGLTDNPRAQLETPYDFERGDDRYVGFSVNLDHDFPTELPRGGWVTFGSIAYGPPYAGAGPVGLRVQNRVGGGGAELRWQRNDTYDFDIPWTGPRVADVRGRWVDFVVRTKLHEDPEVGFVQLWMNTGSGWRAQSLAGRRRLHMQTYDDSNGRGRNNTRLALYYRKDIPGPLTMFHGPARVASAGRGAFSAVAPRSYGPVRRAARPVRRSPPRPRR